MDIATGHKESCVKAVVAKEMLQEIREANPFPMTREEMLKDMVQIVNATECCCGKNDKCP